MGRNDFAIGRQRDWFHVSNMSIGLGGTVTRGRYRLYIKTILPPPKDLLELQCSQQYTEPQINIYMRVVSCKYGHSRPTAQVYTWVPGLQCSLRLALDCRSSRASDCLRIFYGFPYNPYKYLGGSIPGSVLAAEVNVITLIMYSGGSQYVAQLQKSFYPVINIHTEHVTKICFTRVRIKIKGTYSRIDVLSLKLSSGSTVLKTQASKLKDEMPILSDRCQRYPEWSLCMHYSTIRLGL